MFEKWSFKVKEADENRKVSHCPANARMKSSSADPLFSPLQEPEQRVGHLLRFLHEC